MFGWIDIVISFVLGFLACAILVFWAARRLQDKLQAMLDEALAEEVGKTATSISKEDALASEKIIPLKVEVENNRYFCYNNKTNQFVCWGDNVTEIIDHFKQRHPGLNAFFEAGDETALATLKKQLKETRESSNSVRSAS